MGPPTQTGNGWREKITTDHTDWTDRTDLKIPSKREHLARCRNVIQIRVIRADPSKSVVIFVALPRYGAPAIGISPFCPNWVATKELSELLKMKNVPTEGRNTATSVLPSLS